MFRLTGADLPTIKSGSVNTIPPTFRIWQGDSRGMGVLARINTYANYKAPGFDVEQIDIPPVIATGYLLKFLLPFPFKSPSLEGFGLLVDVTSPLPKTLWVGDGVVNLYTQSLALSPLFHVTLLTGAPIPQRAITLVGGFTVKNVTYRGLQISFNQQGEALFINTDYAIAAGDELEIAGTYTASTQFVGYAASFKFPELDHIDRFDWMGTSFAPAPDANNPQADQFIWSESSKLCTVFSRGIVGTLSIADWNYSKRSSPLTKPISSGGTTSNISNAIATGGWAGSIQIVETSGVNLPLTTAWVGGIQTLTDFVAINSSSGWVNNPIPVVDTIPLPVESTTAWQSTFAETLAVVVVDGVVGNSAWFLPTDDISTISLTSGWTINAIAIEETQSTVIQLATGWRSNTLPPCC